MTSIQWATFPGMGKDEHAEIVEQLRRVIAWEVQAQVGVERPIEQIPMLIADTLLDYFDIALKPGADLSSLD